MKTITTIKVVTDIITNTGAKFDALLPLTITIEGGMLTLGSHDGPDLWRAKLKDIS